jgi:hypothetical protein
VLMCAAEHGHSNVVDLLLHFNAATDEKDEVEMLYHRHSMHMCDCGVLYACTD